eukprot:11216864-Lingulodinium_polyedra.AAC.1
MAVCIPGTGPATGGQTCHGETGGWRWATPTAGQWARLRLGAPAAARAAQMSLRRNPGNGRPWPLAL